ncbi:MAG: MFS transporter [Kordiimonadaceae bacterium]|nr:MFS transporter [Kordiimonadaceae bacterium]MBT6330187.1 MFS transporter [Kordiimonadaceae bacterium]
MSDPSTLRLKHVLGWSTGGLATAVYLGITMNYFLYFLTEGAAISPGFASVVLLAPRIWDVITDPIMGAISDRTPGRMGRRRPWILFGGMLFSFSFYMMFAIPDFDSEMARGLWVMFFYLLVGTAYTMYEVPLNAMLPELSQDFQQRGRLASYMMIVIRAGLIGTMLIGPFIFAATEDLAVGFRQVGLFAAIVIAGCSLVVFFTTQDAPRTEFKPVKMNVLSELKALWGNKPFVILVLVHLVKMTGIGAAATTVIYYLVFALKAPEQAAGVILSIYAAAATAFIPFWMWVMARVGKKMAYSYALGFLILSMLPLLFIGPNTIAGSFSIPYVEEIVSGGVVAVAIAMIVVSFGDSGSILVPNGMIPDTVEADELKTGTRREGTIFGAWAFSRKLGMALGAYAVTVFLSQTGFIAGAAEQPEQAITGIRYVYVLFPCTCYLLSIIILHRYDLTEEKFKSIVSDLASRDEKR